jgi:hypothetical protein
MGGLPFFLPLVYNSKVMKLISKTGFNLVLGGEYIYFVDRDENEQDKFLKTNLETITEINKDEYILAKCGSPVNNLDPYA